MIIQYFSVHFESMATLHKQDLCGTGVITNKCNIIYYQYKSFTSLFNEVNISWMNNCTNGGICEYIPHSMI